MQKILIAIAIAVTAAYAGISASSARNNDGMSSMMTSPTSPPPTYPTPSMMGPNRTQF
jgi:hypothetical protein